MKNSDAFKHHSISKRLSLGLVITLIVVAGISLVVNYILSSQKARTELEIKSNEYIAALTDTLRLPIWEYNEEAIKTIGASYFQNEFISQLLVEGPGGLVFFKNEKPDEQSVVSRSNDILQDGQFIGRVHIALASGYYDAVNRQNFWSFSLTIIAMIGALLIMTSVLLRQFLNKPMSRFIDMVNSFAAGHSDAFKKGIPYSEFVSLVNVLDKMGDKIESQMLSLQLTQYAVDSSSVAVYWIDLDSHITYANNAAIESTQYSKEELEQMSLTDIESNLSKEAWRERLGELKLEGSLFFESVHLRRDKSTFPVVATATLLEFADREYIFAFVSDITRRKKAEEEIKALAEFEKFSKLAVGREKIMIGLKEEINELLRRLDEPEKYKIVN